MERLYNPDLMSEAEIRQTFVARQPKVDELLDLVKAQPEGAGIQHVVIIAPRGMGKTTILLMVQFALADRDLDKDWQAVRFPEESYGVNDLADFWLETLRNLAEAVNEPELAEKADALSEKFSNAEDLQGGAYALLSQWSHAHKKRLLLLVDNFDQILEQINSDQDNAALRNVLMNEGTVMLIGGAPSIFREARDYDQPLYNFFKIVNLPELSFEDVQDLLRQRAAVDGAVDFETTLQSNTGRLRVLRYFTGGNPRLVLMLYRVVEQSEVTEVRDSLEKLLDEVTPYYKAKIDSLAPQQRKILDHIARVSSQTNEGLTPGEIAKATRVSPQSASKQLQRLGEMGYVRAANTKGRQSYYSLSEPLYAIWHQMRFGRGAKRRMQWLVDFLKGWYDADELSVESRKLDAHFQEFVQKGQVREASEALLKLRYIAHAMPNAINKSQAVEKIILGHLEISELTVLKEEVLPDISLGGISHETIDRLFNLNCISQSQVDEAKSVNLEQEYFESSMKDVIDFLREKRWGDVLGKLSEMSIYRSKMSEEVVAYVDWFKGFSLFYMKKYEESVEYLENSLQFFKEKDRELERMGMGLVGRGYYLMGRYENSIKYFDEAVNDFGNDSKLWYWRGISLDEIGREEEAAESFKNAVKISPEVVEYWVRNAAVLYKIGRDEEAERCSINAEKIWITDESKDDEKIAGHTLRFIRLSRNHDYERAKFDFLEILKINDIWGSSRLNLSQALLAITLRGSGDFVRKIILETHTEERFFPLYRALEYLSTGDELLIEKLSPEIQKLVMDMVSQIRLVSGGRALTQPYKKKTALRTRTNKKLN